MSGCRVVRELSDVSHALSRAKAESEKFRSLWDGDEARGRYVLRTPLGAIEGTYTVDVRTITFVVDKKPRIVPCMLIEKVLDEFLKQNGALAS